MNVVPLETPIMTATVRRDGEFNKKIAKACQEYWASLGHTVIFTVHFDLRLNVHYITTQDLKNGLPCNERLTPIARRNLTIKAED